MINNPIPFWMVWAEDGKTPIARHMTQMQAEQEAERLALKDTGKKFYVLQAVKSCKVRTPVDWETLEIPF